MSDRSSAPPPCHCGHDKGDHLGRMDDCQVQDCPCPLYMLVDWSGPIDTLHLMWQDAIVQFGGLACKEFYDRTRAKCPWWDSLTEATTLAALATLVEMGWPAPRAGDALAKVADATTVAPPNPAQYGGTSS